MTDENDKNAPAPPPISAVICTYNRSALLAGALESLCRQTLDPACFEIIVVDNNSTDDTAQVCAEFGQRLGNLRYRRETQQGLSHARNRGWREARGRYVGYLDDDGKACPEWLAVAAEVAEKVAPAVFGGPHYPFYLTPKPPWYKDEYAINNPGPEARQFTPGEYVSGGNAFYRRALLEELGGFSPAFGMQGDDQGYGEETELQNRIRRTRPDESIYYDPRLSIEHLVKPDRMRLRAMTVMNLAAGRCHVRIHEPEPQSKTVALARFTSAFLRAAAKATAGALLRSRARYPHYGNYIYERVFADLRQMGKAYQRLRGEER